MKKKYLVTGGSGFLGSALVKRLVRDGYAVRVLDDDSRGRAARLDDVLSKIEFIGGDVRDPKTVLRAARGVQGVCHLAFVNGTEFFYTKPELVLEVGVKGMTNVLDACVALKIPELVLTSSSEVYQSPPRVPTDETAPLSIPDPLNPRYSYAAGKIISEIMALNWGRQLIKRVIVIRPHNVYGPDMGFEHVIPQFATRLAKLPLSNKIAPFKIQGSGRETRSFIYVDDFIDGFVLAMTRGAHRDIYHVGTQEELSIAELARRTAECLGRRVKVVPGAAAVGGTPRRCPDVAKLKRLGFKPKTPLAVGLPIAAKWYEREAR